MATVLSRNSSGLVKCWRTNKRLGAGFKWMMIILGPLDHVIDDNDVLFVVVNLTSRVYKVHICVGRGGREKIRARAQIREIIQGFTPIFRVFGPFFDGIWLY